LLIKLRKLKIKHEENVFMYTASVSKDIMVIHTTQFKIEIPVYRTACQNNI